MTVNKELDRMMGELIRQSRLESKLTQERISDIIDISAVYWRSIEKGLERPNWVIMSKICDVLKINTTQIIEFYIRPELKFDTNPKL